MRILRSDLWLCVECMLLSVNGDVDANASDARVQTVVNGLASLASYQQHVLPDFDSETGEGIREFSHHGCDACGCELAGSRHRFSLATDAPEYTDPASVLAVRRSPTPLARTRTGYGSKLPTSAEIQLADKRWRRVYVICWSNSGTAYVLVRGKRILLDTDTEHRIRAAS